MKFLVTGAAGFIGFHVTKRLCDTGHEVIGIDNLSGHSNTKLQQTRLDNLSQSPSFTFIKLNLAKHEAVESVFRQYKFDKVIHLAAQVDDHYSQKKPFSCIDSNVVGMLNILENCRHKSIQHLVYASSFTVYGMNRKLPFSTLDQVDHPLSLYAASKRSSELMAHTYSNVYDIPVTGLRFFTVYGPWDRHNSIISKMTRAIIEGNPVKLPCSDKIYRDFTFIDDILESTIRMQNIIPARDEENPAEKPSTSKAPYRIYNIGNNNPIKFSNLIGTIENITGKQAVIQNHPMLPENMYTSCADVEDLEKAISFKPNTNLTEGLSSFIDWYYDFYHQNKN